MKQDSPVRRSYRAWDSQERRFSRNHGRIDLQATGSNTPGGLWAQWLEWAADIRRSRGKPASHALRLQVAAQWRARTEGVLP